MTPPSVHTPEGRSALDHLNAAIASADDDILTPPSEAEREQLNSLLRRVHAHHEGTGLVTGSRPAAQARQP